MTREIIKNNKELPEYIFSTKFDCFFFWKIDYITNDIQSPIFLKFFSSFLNSIGEKNFYLADAKDALNSAIEVEITYSKDGFWNKSQKKMLGTADEILLIDEKESRFNVDINSTNNSNQNSNENQLDYILHTCPEICIYGVSDRWCAYGSWVTELMIIG